MTAGGRITVGLAVALVGLVAAAWTVGGSSTGRNVEFWPEMVTSVPAETFGATPAFDDGKVLQLPAPGAIPRGLLPLRYGTSPEEAARAGIELTNPFGADNEEAVARGGVVFATYCTVCHGAAGDGDGSVTRRGVPPPPSLHAENALALPDGHLFHVVTYGQGNMPGYATQIEREDRWKAILYVRRLQSETALPPSPPDAVAAPAPLP